MDTSCGSEEVIQSALETESDLLSEPDSSSEVEVLGSVNKTGLHSIPIRSLVAKQKRRAAAKGVGHVRTR